MGQGYIERKLTPPNSWLCNARLWGALPSCHVLCCSWSDCARQCVLIPMTVITHITSFHPHLHRGGEALFVALLYRRGNLATEGFSNLAEGTWLFLVTLRCEPRQSGSWVQAPGHLTLPFQRGADWRVCLLYSGENNLKPSPWIYPSIHPSLPLSNIHSPYWGATCAPCVGSGAVGKRWGVSSLTLQRCTVRGVSWGSSVEFRKCWTKC